MKHWSNAELSVVKDLTLTCAKAAAIIHRTKASVQGKRQRLGLSIPKILSADSPHKEGHPHPMDEKTPSTFEEDRQRAGEGYWREQYKVLNGKYERALKEGSVSERLVSLAREIAPLSYDPAPGGWEIANRPGNTAQSAVLMLSDTHVGQVIPPDQTLGYGKYDFSTFLARLHFYERAVTSIIRDHTTTPLSEIVVCLGGDMIHGALNHGAEAGQHSTLFEQFYGAGHVIAQFLRNLSRLSKLRIYCTVGNHPRWQNQHKMPTDNRYSNLDQFLYAYIEALTREIPGIQWNIDKQPSALFDVQGYKFHLSHGDHLKGGDKALGIPNHAVGRMVSSTSQLFGKTLQASPHYYLVGHLHRSIVLPHGRGSFIVNGGFPGVDGFGLAGGFSPVDPTQVFFMVHPKFGKTATYDIQLKLATESDADYYTLPRIGFSPA